MEALGFEIKFLLVAGHGVSVKGKQYTSLLWEGKSHIKELSTPLVFEQIKRL